MSASLFTFDSELWLSTSEDGKPVELAGGCAGSGVELPSVGSGGSTGTDVFGGRPSFGREAGLLPSRIFATLHDDQ